VLTLGFLLIVQYLYMLLLSKYPFAIAYLNFSNLIIKVPALAGGAKARDEWL